jgi:hypothetical protein
MFGPAEPTASIRLAPVPPSDPNSAALLPAAAIASPVVAKVLGLYRMLLAEALGCTQVKRGLKAALPAVLGWSARTKHYACLVGFGSVGPPSQISL